MSATLLRELRRSTQAALCLECGKCSSVCPLAASGDFSAARMLSIQDPETEIREQSGAIQRCLTCGACSVLCPQGVRYSDYVLGLRPELPADTRRACPHGAALQWSARLESQAEAPARDLSWIGPGLRVAEKGELALFVGCMPQTGAAFAADFGLDLPEITRSAIRILNHLGIEPVLLPEERCCGHDLLWGGEPETFRKLAGANARAFEARGVKHILTTCAECCRSWRLDYPELTSYRPKVEHFSEFLAARLDAGELDFGAIDPSDGAVENEAAPQTLTYHDPCRLGRQLEAYEAPRSVLDALPGRRLVEMDRSRADALCCGTSGFIHCDAASREIQASRLADAASTGASTLVTACPKCLVHLRCAQAEDRRMGREAIPVVIEDFTVFSARALSLAVPCSPQALALIGGSS